MRRSNISLSIDMGGSKFIVGYVNDEGSIICKRRYLWSKLDKTSVVSDVFTAVKQMQKEYPQINPNTVGVTIPGLADPQKGLWVESSFSGIRNLNIVDIFSKEFGLPVYIDNDTRACALAEKLFGVCKDNTDFIWITVSNGIGGAIFANNQLYYGGFGNAGEIGHCVVVDDGGRMCKCGSIGCLEVHAAGPAIAKNYLELGGYEIINGDKPTAQSIADLARAGDTTAIATYRLEGQLLGKAIAMVSNIINPQKIVIGGGVSLAFDLFKPHLLETVEKQVYNAANKNLKIQQTGLGYEAGLLGAAALGFMGEIF